LKVHAIKVFFYTVHLGHGPCWIPSINTSKRIFSVSKTLPRNSIIHSSKNVYEFRAFALAYDWKIIVLFQKDHNLNGQMTDWLTESNLAWLKLLAFRECVLHLTSVWSFDLPTVLIWRLIHLMWASDRKRPRSN